MKWLTKISEVKIGVDYLIQTHDDQYLAGKMVRTNQNNLIQFQSSDGVWNLYFSDIKKFTEIN